MTPRDGFKCSNCSERFEEVTAAAGVQLCKGCVAKLEVPKNIRLFGRKK